MIGVIKSFLQDIFDDFLYLEFRNALLQSIFDESFSDFVDRCLNREFRFFPYPLRFGAVIRVKLERIRVSIAGEILSELVS